MNAHPHPDPARQAALMLHAMVPEDQHWVVAQLPAADRERIQPLLAELQSLGIAADAECLKRLSPLPHKQQAQAALAGVSPADVQQLARLLAEEPPELTARLLRMQAWPWRDALLAGLAPGFRSQVEAAATADAPALDAALREAIRARLPAPREQVAPSPWWHVMQALPRRLVAGR